MLLLVRWFFSRLREGIFILFLFCDIYFGLVGLLCDDFVILFFWLYFLCVFDFICSLISFYYTIYLFSGLLPNGSLYKISLTGLVLRVWAYIWMISSQRFFYRITVIVLFFHHLNTYIVYFFSTVSALSLVLCIRHCGGSLCYLSLSFKISLVFRHGHTGRIEGGM